MRCPHLRKAYAGTGAPVINHVISDRDSLLDYLGIGFSGLYFAESNATGPLITELSGELDVGEEQFALIIIARVSFSLENIAVIHDKDGELFSAYDAKDSSFYLVRPDRHISARWKNINIDEVRQAFTQILSGGSSE